MPALAEQDYSQLMEIVRDGRNARVGNYMHDDFLIPRAASAADVINNLNREDFGAMSETSFRTNGRAVFTSDRYNDSLADRLFENMEQDNIKERD